MRLDDRVYEPLISVGGLSVNRTSEIPASPFCPETLKLTPKQLGMPTVFRNVADVRLDRGTYPLVIARR